MTGQVPDEPIELRAGDRALFASDMHLGEHDRDTAGMFLECMRQHVPHCTHLFLLGDLFEAWVGDDWADAVCEETLQALSLVTSSGCRLFVMRGNRDFLLDVPLPPATGGAAADRDGPGGFDAAAARAPAFSMRTGARMLTDPCVVSLFGRPALLSHGDALCTDDREYQRFRALTRDPQWQQAFLARPREERMAIAQDLRARSELSKSTKSDAIMDVNVSAVAEAMRGARVRLLLHGHTHRPARHRFELDGEPAERIVLPDWDRTAGRGKLLLATAEGFTEL